MKIKISSLKVDTKAEADGAWIDVNEWAGLNPENPFGVTSDLGLKFRVRSVNDAAYKVARQKAIEEFENIKDDYPDGVVPDAVSDALLGKVIADTLLLEWDGFDEPYSAEYAATVLADPDSRNLRNMVIYCANRVGKRYLERIEEAAKN